MLELVRNALNDDARRRLYVARGVDVATVREIEATQVLVGSFDPAKAEGEETVSIADRIVRNVPLGFVYLLWISIFTVMQMLLNNTIEEKSNRIVDVLLSSVTPGELMMGKLFGIAAIGFTIVATWLVTAFAGLQFYQGAGAEVVGQALDAVAGSGLVPMFLLCFLFGYLIYAGLFLSLGALCNDLKEAQSLQGPVMLIMMVPLFTMVSYQREPARRARDDHDLDTALHAVHDDEPCRGRSAAARADRCDGAHDRDCAALALVGGPHLQDRHPALRQPSEARRGRPVAARPRRRVDGS